jgi:hypothetical protein
VLSGHGRQERLAFGPWIAGALLLIWLGKGLFSEV